MRIRDWSSDVCSSDLQAPAGQPFDVRPGQIAFVLVLDASHVKADQGFGLAPRRGQDEAAAGLQHAGYLRDQRLRPSDVLDHRQHGDLVEIDRTSVVSGKSVSVRVDLGGGRFIKKKTITR